MKKACMKKFQATIRFDMDDNFMSLIPEHREYISSLIQQGVIDQYLVSMESQRVWITFTAEEKEDIEQYLLKSPIHRYWTYEIDELFLIDGQHYRLPALQMN
jgi:hypothetical protein